MTRKSKSFKMCSRGQAYSLEATVAALLITVGILFILPSIAVPIDNQSIGESQLETQVSDDIQQMLEMHRENGQLKSLLLNYDSGWQAEYPGEGEYAVGPQANVRPGFGDQPGHYRQPPGPVGKSILDIEEKHNVWIQIYLLPAGDQSEVDRVPFVEESSSENVLVREKTTILLHENDRLQSVPKAHMREESATPIDTEGGDKLVEAPESNYPIGENEELSDTSVYNTVTVEVLVYTQEER